MKKLQEEIPEILEYYKKQKLIDIRSKAIKKPAKK
jgi:hypothetical protein